jgi:hypothetical protein
VQPDYVYEIEETLGFSEQTDYLSAHYIKVEPTTFGDLYVAPTMAAPASWLYSVIDDPAISDVKAITSAGSGSVLLPNVSSSHEITIIPTNIYTPENDYAHSEDEYSFQVSLGEVENFRPGIQRIHPNPFQPAVHTGGLKIDVRLTEKTKRIIYTVLNENGFTVFTDKVKFDSALNGDFSLFWDGRSSHNEIVASGIYLIYIDAGQEIEPGKIAVIR